jgi:hypothetical protein
MGSWGVASFENDAAADWFLLVEEAVDPGAVMASAIDDALSGADHLEGDASCEAGAGGPPSVSPLAGPRGRRPAWNPAARWLGRVRRGPDGSGARGSGGGVVARSGREGASFIAP